MGERDDIAHLLRRATFGPTAQQVDAAERAGYAATVDGLLAPSGVDRGAAATPPPALAGDPYARLGKNPTREQQQAAQQARREQVGQLTAWWLRRMAVADHQLTEKLVFFWHGHWATSVQKVKAAQLMLAQQETFRRHGRGDFAGLVRAMLRDSALIFWLDGQRNTAKAPNENLARELMELFTLGIAGGYTEDDVKAGARALTGWTVDRTTGASKFEPNRHDSGVKTILGTSGKLDADGFADILTSQPSCADFLAGRLWLRFGAGAALPAPTRAAMTSAYGADRDVTAMVRAMFLAAEFRSARGQLAKQPVEWAIGAARQLGLDLAGMADKEGKQLLGGLNQLGQVPFRPPSVGGWPTGAAWLTTFSAQVRMGLAEDFAKVAAPTVVDTLEAAPAEGRPDALARLLVVDAWTERTRQALAGAKGNPRKLLALGLASPEYLVH